MTLKDRQADRYVQQFVLASEDRIMVEPKLREVTLTKYSPDDWQYKVTKLLELELTFQQIMEIRNRILFKKSHKPIGDQALLIVRSIQGEQINLTDFDSFFRDELGIDLLALSQNKS